MFALLVVIFVIILEPILYGVKMLGSKKHSQMLLLSLSFFFDLDPGQGCDFQKCF